VLGRFTQAEKISEVEILMQATSGLAHLHSLDIGIKFDIPISDLDIHVNLYFSSP
jgi:hypothetical protein